MIKYKYVLFDLDGTVSASAEGIRMSLEHALDTLGVPKPDLDDYTLYIGPPLIDTFKNLCGLDDETAEKGAALYREYYDKEGKYHNKVYDGIKELVFELRKKGAKTAICTSKQKPVADGVAKLLGIEDWFDKIVGSTLDNKIKDKKDLIPYALAFLGGDIERDRADTVMIGDSRFDAVGAKLCEVDVIGVSYGYGSVDEMLRAGANAIADSPKELSELLLS